VHVIGSIRNALDAAAAAARSAGYGVHVIDTPTVGEARAAGAAFASAAIERRSNVPMCVLAGGETTVTVRGTGRGGRNQECALGMADVLARAGVEAIGASVGTDGIDGPTDAAGAVVDGNTIRRARKLGFDVDAALVNNDSFPLLHALGALVLTGPTGANVGDVQVMLLDAGTRRHREHTETERND
jgi:glycerate-2-kinase